MADYTEEIADVREAIIEDGELVVWTQQAGAVVPGQPWKRTPNPVSFANTPMIFFPPGNAWQVAKAYGVDIPVTAEVGYLPGDVPFKPSVNDTVTRADGTTNAIRKIDRLAPSGVPIMFFVYIV